MKIRVMSVTGLNEIDEVWKISRPDSTSKAEIIDAPLWDFVRYTLEITSTILERDKIALLRDNVMWAQTSRVIDPLDFKVERENSLSRVVRQVMYKDKNLGVSQDQYRLQLPVQALTTYCINISMRTLARMIKSGYIDANPIELYSETLFNMMGIVKPIDLSVNYSWETIKVKIPIALYSQLIRHKNLNLKLESEMNENSCLFHLVWVGIFASDNAWREILTKRSCWLADKELWKPIMEHPDLQYLIELPCHDGVCPFSADAEERINGTDPGEPCPHYQEIKDATK